MKTKTLCQVCLDNYSDEGFCLGRCCGHVMVYVPLDEWFKVRHAKREVIKEMINKYGKELGK